MVPGLRCHGSPSDSLAGSPRRGARGRRVVMLSGVTLLPHPLVRRVLPLARTTRHRVARRPGVPVDAGRGLGRRRTPPGRRRRPGRAGRAGLGLLGLPAPGLVARAGRPPEAGVVRLGALLGQADRRLGRPGAGGADRGAGPGGQRRQPDRPRLHRRLVGGLAVRLAAPGRAGDPGDVRARRGRPAAARRPDGRDRAVRAAAEQADHGRARHLPALDPPGDRPGRRVPAGRGGARRVRLDRRPRRPRRGRVRRAAPAPQVRPRRLGRRSTAPPVVR